MEMIPTGLPDLSKPSRVQNSSSKPEFLTPKFLYKKFGFKKSGFLMEFWTLVGLERSGRPVGIISTHFRQNPLGGFRAMTKKPKMLTTKKVTTTLMRA